MGLLTVKEILAPVDNSWAVGAFNVHNLEDVQAVAVVASQLDSPVIIMVSESALNYAGARYLSNLVQAAAVESGVPMALQLDHAKSLQMVQICLDVGFSAVMIDGSHLGYTENVLLTKQVVEEARRFGASVEAELGRIGGKEDDLEVSDRDANMTDPRKVAEFIEATGLDVFAPAVGTAHGLYRGQAKIDFSRLKSIRLATSKPLALHGCSDLPVSVIEEIIAHGVEKINVGTDLKIAMTDGLRNFLAEHPQEFETRKVFAAARTNASIVVREKIQLFGSVNKAHVYRS